MGTYWKIAPATSLHFKHWDEELVVFNSISGNTHLLGSDATYVLLKLQQAPANIAMLIEHLSIELQTDANEAFKKQIEQVVSQLCNLDLIEPA